MGFKSVHRRFLSAHIEGTIREGETGGEFDFHRGLLRGLGLLRAWGGLDWWNDLMRPASAWEARSQAKTRMQGKRLPSCWKASLPGAGEGTFSFWI